MKDDKKSIKKQYIKMFKKLHYLQYKKVYEYKKRMNIKKFTILKVHNKKSIQ